MNDPGGINRDRLRKVLALLSSPVDGEALAAARKVVALLAAAGKRPEELIEEEPGPGPIPGSKLTGVAGYWWARWSDAHHNAQVFERQVEAKEAELVRLRADLAELEETRPALDWLAIIERMPRGNPMERARQREIEFRARTGKLTAAEKVALREFARVQALARKAGAAA